MRPHHWLHLNRYRGNQPLCPVIAFIRSPRQQPNHRSQGSKCSCREAPVYGSGCAPPVQELLWFWCATISSSQLYKKKKVPSCRTALLMSLHIVPHGCFLELEGRQEAAVWDVMDGYSQIVTHWNSQGERWYGMGQGSEKEFYKLSLI